MTNIPGLKVDVGFGGAETALPDWRKSTMLRDEIDPDDEQIETPPDVVAVLGFDPATEEDEENQEEEDAAAPDKTALNPFRSEAQRRFLFAKHPEIAQRWAREERAGQNRPAQAALNASQLAAMSPAPALAKFAGGQAQSGVRAARRRRPLS
jgi:hypothetical protein